MTRHDTQTHNRTRTATPPPSGDGLVVTTIRARGERRFKPKHETEAEWQKEARFLLSLRHPNIIQIYDMFEHLGTTTYPPPPDQVAHVRLH